MPKDAEMYEVVVPVGLASGDTFVADVGGTQMSVQVPEGVRGGMSVRVAAPSTAAPVSQGRQLTDEEIARSLQDDELRQAGLGGNGRRWHSARPGDEILLQTPPPGHVLIEQDVISPAGFLCCILSCPFCFPFNLLGLLMTEKQIVPVRIVQV
jgi:hypothetical protein